MKYLKIVVLRVMLMVMMMKDEGPIRCQHEADDDLSEQECCVRDDGLQVEATRHVSLPANYSN